MAAVYFIASYDVTDPTRYENQYVPGVEATLHAAGAEVVVATGSAEVLEGGAVTQHVVFGFTSREAFRAWYDGAGYESLRKVRDETTSNHTAVLAREFRGDDRGIS